MLEARRREDDALLPHPQDDAARNQEEQNLISTDRGKPKQLGDDASYPLEVGRLIDDHFLMVAQGVEDDDILFVQIEPCRLRYPRS